MALYRRKAKTIENLTEVKTQNDKYKVSTITCFDGSCDYEVVESVENRMIVFHVHEKTFCDACREIFRIEPIGFSCKSSDTSDLGTPNVFVRFILFNIFTLKFYESKTRKVVENLKRILEM